eukprot:10965318-Ditylum_brightwellii.AAC.1
MARAKPKAKGKDGKIKEFLAEKGHHGCIHTVDCNDDDKVEHDQANNDSGHESDWYNCTCVCPGKYRACKAAETKSKAWRSNNKCMKCSH